MSDDPQIDWVFNDGVIVWVLLGKTHSGGVKSIAVGCTTHNPMVLSQSILLEGGLYHFGGQLLEQLADQAARGLRVGDHRLQEVLQVLLQAGRGALHAGNRRHSWRKLPHTGLLTHAQSQFSYSYIN